jgi:thiosulfate reductase cytochrome b subunit
LSQNPTGQAAKPAQAASDPPQGGDLVRRHSRVTRVWHWINALTLWVMLSSGLMILNAHPRLYWGHAGANADHAWLELAGMDELAFPGWLTLPSYYSLADARLWHLTFAWVLGLGLLGYLLWALLSGHVKRQLRPGLAELAPAHVWHDIQQHARLRFPTGAAALNYNVLQKLAYGSVLFVLLPLVILTGLTMSPGLNAAWPWLVDLFGGRQSARSLHFLAASGLVLFFLVHIAMVVLAGPINELRAMITGWYRLPQEPGQECQP